MKLINYYYGYIPAFSCSIHGKITMTTKEWEEALLYIKRAHRRFDYYAWSILRVLDEDCTRSIPSKKGRFYNIRVPATEAIAEHYGLDNYKRGNYMIEVLQ